MNLLLPAWVLFLAGCAHTLPAPGTGEGVHFSPYVDMRGVDAKAYRRDLADCRRYGADDLERPERVILNCMIGRGYRTLNHAPMPSFVNSAQVEHVESARVPAPDGWVTTPRVGASAQTLPAPTRGGRTGGRDLVQAERYARARNCAEMPEPLLAAKGPGFETYRIACTSGDILTVRCEFGNCGPARQ